MSELYDNLLKATDNTNDITNEKYGTVTKINGALCSVLEEDTNLEHTNVPVLNQIYLETGDKVVIGFVSNSIYNPIIVGNLTRGIRLSTDDILEPSSLNNLGLPANSSQHQINLKVNEKINQGGGGSVDIVTEWETTTSDSKVASEKLTKDTLDTKVDKENGKGLSSNDFTDSYKSTMDNLKTVATTGSYTDLSNKPSIPSASSSTPNADTSNGAVGTGTTWARADHKHPKSSIYAESSHTHTKSQITDFPILSSVATSGSYNDLSNKPSIPSSSSDLSDGSDLVKKSSTSGLLKNDGSVDTNSYLTSSSLSNYVQKSSTTGLLKNDGTVDTTQYLSSLPTHNHDDRYYTESEIDTALNGKQATLISGTNIKTINNTSLLGSGNINIQGGGTVTVDDSLSTTSTNPVQNKVITGALNGKANSSHTHLSSDVTDLIDVIYPVGAIYMSVNSVNPATLFGGEWEQIKDKFLLSSGDVYTNGATGGSADAVVVSHTHTQQSHSHTNTDGNFVTSDVAGANNTRVNYSANGNRMVDGIDTTKSIFHHRHATSGTTAINNATGVDGTGKNMPPYIVVNVWKRTA